MNDGIGIRIAEALVTGGPPATEAHPEVAIGDLNGPFGAAFAAVFGSRSRTLASLDTDIIVRPATLCVSKVPIAEPYYASILNGTVRYATAAGVLDAVHLRDIPISKVNDIGIIISVWLNPAITAVTNIDHWTLFEIHREATARAIQKAMRNEHSINWLLKNQERIIPKYFVRAMTRTP